MKNKFVKSAIITLGALMISSVITLIFNLVLPRFLNVNMINTALGIVLRLIYVTFKAISIFAAFFIVKLLTGDQQPIGKVFILSVCTALVTEFLLPIVFLFIHLPAILSYIIPIAATYTCVLVGSMIFGISE